MSKSNPEQILREAESKFDDEGHVYSNPFTQFGKKTEASVQALAKVGEAAAQVPNPDLVKSQSKPELLPDNDSSEDEGEKDESSSDSESDDEDEKKKENEDKQPSSSAKVNTSTSADRPRTPEPSNEGSPEGVVSSASKSGPAQVEADKKPGVVKKDTMPEKPEQKAAGSSQQKTPPRETPSRRSSELSPFSGTNQRKASFTLRPGSVVAGVRSGGVTSPPPSDTASIAGKREDQEDDLDQGFGNATNLLDELASAPRLSPKTDKKEKKKTPNHPSSKGSSGKKNQSALKPSHVRTGSVAEEGEKYMDHEVRVSVLEKMVAAQTEELVSLRSENEYLKNLCKDLEKTDGDMVDKTDNMIDEFVRAVREVRDDFTKAVEAIKIDMIMEINEKTKRVGGPARPAAAPAVTITNPSPVTASGVTPLPSNVVASSPSTSSPVSSAPNPQNMTPEALRKWLKRMGQLN
jgi:hypothetical protein